MMDVIVKALIFGPITIGLLAMFICILGIIICRFQVNKYEKEKYELTRAIHMIDEYKNGTRDLSDAEKAYIVKLVL